MAIDIELHGRTSGTIRDRAGRKREELLRLGVHPRESPQQSAAVQKELLEDWQ
jgi:hypothetical protein